MFSTLIIVLSIASVFNQAFAQSDLESAQDLNRRHYIGSSLFVLAGNLAPGDPPHYFQVNYGHQPTLKDVIIAEAITRTYYEPLGTYESSEREYPGKISAYGIGVGYQRFLWNGLYSRFKATPFLQRFSDEEDKHIQNGFQLFLVARLGYRFEFFNQRWFLEPSVAFNYWPINTNFPDSFKEIESGKPNYFLFEPGLHFGYMF